MSKKICFSSVLKQKRGSQTGFIKQQTQLSLQQMVEQYAAYPGGDYTLRYAQSNSLRSGNSKQGFQEGYNPLDHWIHNQIQHNKQNISDTQPRRQIPNELLKYTSTGNKSPRRLSQVKSDFTGSQHDQSSHRNVDMKQICRQYAENKKKGKEMSKDGPVWKFSSKQESQYEEDHGYDRQKAMKQTEQIRQSITNQRFKEQPKLGKKENQFLHQEFSKLKQEKITNAVKALPQKQAKGQNLSSFIQQIKNNLAHQIQAMAQRIIQDRKATEEEDQELLLSQRQNQQQRDQKRFDQARKQIGEYLSMKQEGNSFESKDNSLNQTPSLPKKRSSKNEDNRQLLQKPEQKNTSVEHQHVGYSFASDINGQGTPQQSYHKNESKTRTESQTNKQSIPKIKKQSESNLNLPSSQISLANIDEIKSEQDGYQKINDDFVEESVAIKKYKVLPQAPQIDKNYIKQIQSVAYTEPATDNPSTNYTKFTQQERRQYSSQIPQSGPQKIDAQTKEYSEKVEKKSKNGSIFQQVSKTAMSIEQWQDGGEVNISVVQGQQSPSRGSKHGSAKNTQQQKNIPHPEVQAFVAPANAVKIQFKKVASPDRLQKKQGSFNKQPQSQPAIQPTTVTSTTAGGSYFTSYPSTSISTTPVVPPSTTTTVPTYKTSFSNILQTQQNTNTTTTTTTYPSQTPTPPSENQGIKLSQQTLNQGIPPSIQSSTSYQIYQPSYPQTQIQNSRQRNNSLKNSGHEQGRKIKITISPKYQGNDQDKHDFVAPVGDFKVKPEQTYDNTTTPSYQTSANTYNPSPSTNTNNTIKTSFSSTLAQNTQNTTPVPACKQSIGTSGSTNTNRTQFKIDNLFANVTPVSNTVIHETRQIKQSLKQKQHAMIRVEKYQRVQKVEKVVEPTKAKQSIKNNQSIARSQQFEFDLDF